MASCRCLWPAPTRLPPAYSRRSNGPAALRCFCCVVRCERMQNRVPRVCFLVFDVAAKRVLGAQAEAIPRVVVFCVSFIVIVNWTLLQVRCYCSTYALYVTPGTSLVSSYAMSGQESSYVMSRHSIARCNAPTR
eukprot:626191-Rhodomonas_salina.2